MLVILGIPFQVSSQFNQSRQVEVECGFMVFHYLEDEMRFFREGEVKFLGLISPGLGK